MVVSLKPFQSLSKCPKLSSGSLAGLISPLVNHFETPKNHFVPVENRIVPPENHIVPIENHFVPPKNHFVPVENHIVPLQNHFVPEENDIAPGTGHYSMISRDGLSVQCPLSTNPLNFSITKMYDYEQQIH